MRLKVISLLVYLYVSVALAVSPPQDIAGSLDQARRAYQDRQLGDAERHLRTAIDLARQAKDAQALQRRAPQAGASKGPLRVGIDVPPPKRTRALDPIYPRDAMRALATGIVMVEAVIDKNGKVSKADVIRSIRTLDTAARNAVREWRFEPTVQNGRPVDVVAIFVLDFSFRAEPLVTDDLEIGKVYVERHDYTDTEFVLTRALQTVQTEQRWFGARPGDDPRHVGQQTSAGGVSIQEPKKTKHVPPPYPQLAQQARAQGVVIVEAVIDKEGRVGYARVVKSAPLLDQTALDAVRQWEFTPSVLNGVPIEVAMTVTVNFTLTGR